MMQRSDPELFLELNDLIERATNRLCKQKRVFINTWNSTGDIDAAFRAFAMQQLAVPDLIGEIQIVVENLKRKYHDSNRQ